MSHPVTRGILEWLKLLAAEANDETYEFHDYAATEMRDTLGKYGDAIFDLALKGLEDAVCPTCSGSGKETVPRLQLQPDQDEHCCVQPLSRIGEGSQRR